MKFLIFTVLLGVLAASEAISMFRVVLDEWEEFKLTHKKKYDNDIEEKFRMKIYMENKRNIAKHNQQYAKGEHTFKLAMNHYGDMLHHEFVQTMNGFRGSANKTRAFYGATYIHPANVELPKQVDWREKGAVTPVKNQGSCGSCWSFSTTGSLEGQHFRKSGELVSLSEQNLVDCSKAYGNDGCSGGLMDNAFKYIKDNKGIDTEEAYPYHADEEECKYNPTEVGATDVGFVDVTGGSEQDLKSAVATIGPVSVAIDASQESFQFYSKGVYNEPKCSAESLDHGVLVVGYGTDDEIGGDFWLVKNSWGPEWGDEGYIKMARNKDNQCGIATLASYPLV